MPKAESRRRLPRSKLLRARRRMSTVRDVHLDKGHFVLPPTYSPRASSRTSLTMLLAKDVLQRGTCRSGAAKGTEKVDIAFECQN